MIHKGMLGLLAVALMACAGTGPIEDEFAPDLTAAEESVPLGGDALAEKKTETAKKAARATAKAVRSSKCQ